MNSDRPPHARILAVVLSGLLFMTAPATGRKRSGKYDSCSASGDTVTIAAGKSRLRLVLYKPNLVRVECLSNRSGKADISGVVVRNAAQPARYRIVSGDSAISITTSSLRISCSKSPLRISFFDSKGKLLLDQLAPERFSSSKMATTASFTISPNEHFYGTGERGTSFDLRGLEFDSFNEQHGGYPAGGIPPTMNVNIPFVVSSNHYGIYFDDTYTGHFDIGHTLKNILDYTADGGELSYYFIYDPTYSGILSDYTWLTGRAPLLPKWAYGYIQSKFGYRNAGQANRMMDRMRRDSIPCDAIVFDLYWFKNMGDLAWDTRSWPDPRKLISSFKARGFKTIVITEPYIINRSANFAYADTNRLLATDSLGKTYLLKHWWSCGCDAGLLDITNHAAQKWWWRNYRRIFKSGVSGIWTDLGEPERDYPSMMFRAGPDIEIHNVYDFLWAKTLFDEYNRSFPNRRFFNLTRSGYAGIQRFGTVTWSGDVAKSFRGLAVQLPILLNMGMSGITYHNSDIGGFTGNKPTTPELYLRWIEFGAFCPVMRAHGYDRLGGTEPWAFGTATEDIAREIIDLRYSLLPYNYTMAHESYLTGLPMARPLVLEFPKDPEVANESAAYMWGDDILVAPVVRAGELSKTFYLPPGKWVNYWTDSLCTGGSTITVPAPLNEVPLFVKSGSIIPMQAPEEFVGPHSPDEMTLDIYPAPTSDASFQLYEDDGKTLDYQHGQFAETRFEADPTGEAKSGKMHISIGPSAGNYEGKLKYRVYICEIHGVGSKPAAVQLGNSTLPELSVPERLHSVNNGYFYDAEREILFVRISANTSRAYSIEISGVKLQNN